ncbi:hypothetical protein VFPPC_06671 [Pochonia chlamydosporia 170]|uniref:Uncharacterized protein n=1 Tax=Pochonia chlamydosporia 170 TaxID=1380566 RepID=A0A179F5Z6_METCM|nr:hypothetical protein VFPPC_06671 [Pochonia chlamydosporia 170]OAQ60539.2 hypothetical protein VFPPC_06671 [Pochonia chlamydosporia 170]
MKRRLLVSASWLRAYHRALTNSFEVSGYQVISCSIRRAKPVNPLTYGCTLIPEAEKALAGIAALREAIRLRLRLGLHLGLYTPSFTLSSEKYHCICSVDAMLQLSFVV